VRLQPTIDEVNALKAEKESVIADLKKKHDKLVAIEAAAKPLLNVKGKIADHLPLGSPYKQEIQDFVTELKKVLDTQ
jgi:Tfp pilus assembly protein PilO